MSTYTTEQINRMMAALPDDVKEAIASVDTLDTILDLEKKYRLHFDQTGELSNEILLLTIGVTPPQQFIKNVERRLNVSNEVAHNICLEVNEKIFTPIRESLKQIHNMLDSKESTGEDSTNQDSLADMATEINIGTPSIQETNPFKEGAAPETPAPAPVSLPPQDDLAKEVNTVVPVPEINATKESAVTETPVPTPIRIENIPKKEKPEPKEPENKNLAEEKLQKPFTIEAKTTVDPYREPIT